MTLTDKLAALPPMPDLGEPFWGTYEELQWLDKSLTAVLERNALLCEALRIAVAASPSIGVVETRAVLAACEVKP